MTSSWKKTAEITISNSSDDRLETLKEKILQFRDERNWKQFHQLKDLLLGLQIECGELSELFLWKSEEEIADIPKEKIADEIADVFVYINYLSEHFNLDLAQITENKLEKNRQKYPVDKSFNSNKKYNELD